MLLPKQIKKFIAIFRGGISPLMITISIVLGFSFGLIPGFSGVHALILVLFVLLNVHLGLFVISVGLAKGLCLAAAPVMYHAGVFVHSHLGGVFSCLSKVPIVGLTDFSRYSVAAAVVIGPVIGLILGLIMARVVLTFRKTWLKLEDGSEAFKKFSANRWVQIVDRILVGKRAKDVKQALGAKSPVIRKAGVALAVVVVIVCAGAVVIAKHGVIDKYATAMLTKANGAEVNVENIDLSLLTGKFVASGIQVTDPEKPENNQVVIGKVSADANVYDLLCGKVVVNELELSNVQFDTAREKPGEVLTVQEGAAEEPFDPEEYKIPVGDLGELETYFENAKKLKEWMAKLQKWLPEAKEKGVAEPEQIPEGYLGYLRARAVTAPAARFLAKRIVLDGVDIPGEQFAKCRIVISNLSDVPSATGLPVSIEIQSEQGQAVNVTCHFESSDDVPPIKGDFAGIDLAKVQSNLGDKNPVVFKSGTVSGSFDGFASKDFMDLSVVVKVENLKAESSGKGVLGLDAKSASEILGVLKNLDTTLRFVGPTTSPKIVFDTDGLSKEFQRAAVEAGKERLNKELQDAIDENLGDKVPQEIKDVLKKPEDLIKGIGDLFGGKKDE